MLQVFGQIQAPEALSNFGSVEQGAIGKLLDLLIRTLIVGAGIYALINLVLAGYAFISAGDDPKKWLVLGQKFGKPYLVWPLQQDHLY